MNTPFELFYIECGPGWKKLYEPLIERCKREGVDIMQIKEKYGGLRFYVDATNDALFDAIDAAEEESLRVCEVCGDTGRLREDLSWLKTLCDAHYRKQRSAP